MDNRQEFIDKLSKLSKEEMLERYIALLDSEKLTDYVADLEAKLAEKEKQTKTYAHEIAFLDKKIADIKNSCDYYMERANDLVLKQNQTAIAELEKVKENVECVLDNALKNSSVNQSYYDRLLDDFDQQIKSLKGESV